MTDGGTNVPKIIAAMFMPLKAMVWFPFDHVLTGAGGAKST
ncbi:hypothetical protein [Desulfovibrio sp.]|nr:hypothetical protein [Desulfovibrio sp.]